MSWLPEAKVAVAPVQIGPFREVHYELVGDGDNEVIAVLGGISAGRHVTAHAQDKSEGWWQAQCGVGQALDPAEFAILVIDFLGAQLQPGDEVPRVSTHDQAQALAAALDHLDIPRLRAVVGSSYGGMVALAFAALYPERVSQIVVIGAAHKPHPMASAIRSIQRNIVELAAARGDAAAGLDLARRLAMTTYRTAEEFADRFASVEEVGAYLAHCGRRYVEQFTPERFLCLSQSIDLHCVDPAQITVPCTLVAIEGDAIAPPWQIQQLAEQLGERATFIQIQSIYGHDAFLKETAAVTTILKQSVAVEVNL